MNCWLVNMNSKVRELKKLCRWSQGVNGAETAIVQPKTPKYVSVILPRNPTNALH
jgi:hypothetical protein